MDTQLIRKSTSLTSDDWDRLDDLAFQVGATTTGGPTTGDASWRALLRMIARRELVVLPKDRYTKLRQIEMIAQGVAEIAQENA